MKFEFLEHTADLKIRSYGKNISEVLENTVLAISSYISNNEKIESNSVREFEISGKDDKEIFYKFLDEIIYLIDVEDFAPSKARIIFEEDVLKVSLFGDENFSSKIGKIKAATYYGMKIQLKNGFAEFVLDI